MKMKNFKNYFHICTYNQCQTKIVSVNIKTIGIGHILNIQIPSLIEHLWTPFKLVNMPNENSTRN